MPFTSFDHFLNNLPDFYNPIAKLEQYSTPVSLLKKIYNLLFKLNIKNQSIILDLGCGTGRIGFIASFLGTFRVIGIDIDSAAIKIAHKFALKHQILNITFIQGAVEFFPFSEFRNKISAVVMNPPFGTKRQHIDFVFLKRAFETRAEIISLHKNNPQTILKLHKLALNNLYEMEIIEKMNYLLSPTFSHHKNKIYPVNVLLCKFSPKHPRSNYLSR